MLHGRVLMVFQRQIFPNYPNQYPVFTENSIASSIYDPSKLPSSASTTSGDIMVGLDGALKVANDTK